jgi:hypothetical protein
LWDHTSGYLRDALIAEKLAAEFPDDPIVNSYWLPRALAASELNRRNPARAVEELRAAQAYELGQPNPPLAVLGVLYLRGYALLAAGQPKEAAAEFQ